jgi:hypothetical protein
VSPNGPYEQDGANGCPDNSGIVYSKVVAGVHGIEVLAAADIVETRCHSISVAPMRHTNGFVCRYGNVSSWEALMGCHGGEQTPQRE